MGGTWRCPHCATLQVEAPRCFVCGRSATSCATCVNFRPSLIGGVGYCVLDRRREPLKGSEQRGCWSAAAQPAGDGFFDAPSPEPVRVPARSTGARLRHGLVELTPAAGSRRPPAGRE